MNEQKKTNDYRGEGYIGSATCITCHREIYESYIKTAHNLSSQSPSASSIKGSFAKDSNTVYYDPPLKVMMEQDDSNFYQVAYVNDIARQSERFDIVIGSGRKGQSYLYWLNDNIFQLPVSYHVPGRSWANSPNYPPGKVQFERNIPIGCFECHSSYIRKTATKPSGNYLVDYFDKTKIIYGIDCERCHGPAAAHVDFHENNPLEKKPRYITNIAGLPQQEKLDMCAMCHSAARKEIASTFDFKPGEKLSKYFYSDTSSVTLGDIDVHGKQYQLLIASKCFLKSKTLTCVSCHNTHVQERDNLKKFSQACQTCHSDADHSSIKSANSIGLNLESNCIDCHMPEMPSKLITMYTRSKTAPVSALVRTHYISVDMEATKKFLLKNNLNKSKLF